MEDDDDLFDSAELLMMTMDIPDLSNSSLNQQFQPNSDCRLDEFRPRSFLGCELSREFSAEGFILSKEFEAFLKNEPPMPGNWVSRQFWFKIVNKDAFSLRCKSAMTCNRCLHCK